MMLRRVRRRRAVVLIASSLIAVGFVASNPAALAKADVTSDRVAGNDRFQTAAAAAAAAFPTGSSRVLIASGRTFPDALAGAALGLPILLTERDTLPSATAQAIDDLNATDAIILGGTAAVSTGVANEVARHAKVTRLAGNDRYETAAKIAESIGTANVESVGGKKTAIIATGLGFADALAGGPLATGATGAPVLPILLVNDKVPQTTSDALTALGIKQVLILGGTGAVSTSVESDLKTKTGNQPVRLGGSNRYATASVIGDFALDTLGFPGDKTLLASGVNFADALAGGPLGGVRSAPLLLTDPQKLSDDTKAFFADHSATIDRITTLGGTAAVSNAAQSSAKAAAQTTPKSGANETYKITPSTNVNQTNGTSRDYTATGLGATVVDLVIMACNNITASGDGKTLFANSDGDTIADGSAESGDGVDKADTPAAITKVNGSDLNADDPTRTSNDYVAGVTPISGTVTFTISGPTAAGAASTCVRPVVFEDADADNALNVATNGSSPAPPNETFGTGGQVAFSPTGADTGPIGTRNVTGVDRARDTFTACTFTGQATATHEIPDPGSDACRSFTYDANDNFRRSPGSIVMTMAEFEKRLSIDDDISGTYSAVTSGVSTFNLVDEAPVPPGAPSSSFVEGGVKVAWADSETASVDHYSVYRTTVTDHTTPPPCPASVAAAALLATVDATPKPIPPPPDANRYSYTDTATAEGAWYCYNIAPVDGSDDGHVSSGTLVKVPEGPTITAAKGKSDGSLKAGDIHQFVFSRAVSAAATTSTYQVTGNGVAVPYTIDCTPTTGNAACTLSADGLTFRATIAGTPPPLQYPLKVTATNITGTDGKPVNLQTSYVTIQKDTLPS